MGRCGIAALGAVLALVAGWPGAVGGEAPKAGLTIGAKTQRFDVADVTGPSKGKQTCYV